MKLIRFVRQPACTVAGLVIALAVAGIGRAGAQGTDEERRACTPDAMRLCREYIPNIDRIVACMVERRSELSPECQAFIKPDPSTQVATAPAPSRRTAAKPVVRRTGTAPAVRRTAAIPAAARKPVVAVARKPAIVVARKPAVAVARKPATPMNLLPAAGKPAKKKPAQNRQAQQRPS